MSNNTEDLMALIFGQEASANDKDDKTMLDLVDESFEITDQKLESEASQSNRVEDSYLSRRELLNVIEED
jgi:hypothetical protein